MDGKEIFSPANGDGTKHIRDEDMVNHVMAVMAAVVNKVPFEHI